MVYMSFGYVAMDNALLFIVRARLLVYSTGSGVNRVEVVLSGFSKRLFWFVHAKTLCNLSVRTAVKLCILGVLALGVSLVS